MLKLLPLFLLFTSCQVLGIKDTDTIQQAEVKVLHVIEHEAEPPMIVSPRKISSR